MSRCFSTFAVPDPVPAPTRAAVTEPAFWVAPVVAVSAALSLLQGFALL